MHLKLFCLFFLIPLFALSQFIVSGQIVDKNTQLPLPFATILIEPNTTIITSANGEFSTQLLTPSVRISASYVGYIEQSIALKTITSDKITIGLLPRKETLSPVNLQNNNELAKQLIRNTILKKQENNPRIKLNTYSYKGYQKLLITGDDSTKFIPADTSKVALEKIINETHSFLSEKVSLYQCIKPSREKETILATRMSGFKEPVYDIYGIQLQSYAIYEDRYTLFETDFASPLSSNGYRNYYYKILDTTKTKHPAYVVLFQPKKAKKNTKLEGILYLNTKTLAVQQAIMEVKGELEIKAAHQYQYLQKENIWIPSTQSITVKPGQGTKKVSLFGGQISVGSVATSKKTDFGNNDILNVTTHFFDFKNVLETDIRYDQAAIEINPEARQQPENFWSQYRTKQMTRKDRRSFPIIDSIVKAQRIERRIDVIKNFNKGYYPVGMFNFDLTYPIKFNNYEGVRTGIGGITNQKLSDTYRFEGYLVYGFRDRRFKFGLGGGIHLNERTESWLNVNYTDDLRELGSFFYLTDKRVYSLFEPRLVNITAFYAHRSWSSSIQHRILPQLLSEVEIRFSDIDQIGGYQFITNEKNFSSYQIAESTLAFRWTPFSKFLKSPEGFTEIHEKYPKITAQYVQGYKGILDSDFNYHKFGLKIQHTIKSLDQSNTSFLVEGDIASDNIPITHLFHAYPNAPTKEVILQRFSVAGRRSFETMYFNEFFSDRLATLQIRHTLRPFELSKKTKPELVLISRYALGDIRNPENHVNINPKSLKEFYQESGFEINKLFAGFGLSFAYRYGAYHLPDFEDNIAFKFTFYLKL